MFNRHLLPLLGFGLLAGGCSLAPTYERPAPVVATAYPSAEAGKPDGTALPATDIGWREFYRDPRLNALQELALANNRDLRVAALNVERVRALYGIQRTALIPSLDATGDASRRRTPGDVNGTGVSRLSDSYSVGLEIPSYEVDFFGRVASLRDQVLQQYLASQEAQTSARLSIVSSVARQYFTLLAADEQLALARETLATAEASYKLNLQTFQAGASSELDLRSAEAQRETYRASVAALGQQRARAENALVLLIGCPLPASLPAASSLERQELVEDIPAGLPSELLMRRPDLRQAEHTLQAANANIGVARAAFFPAVKLTAFGGSASTELSGLFDSGSRAWSFAPSITLPLFASGKNKALLEVANIQKRIEVANYEKAIQSAFREVADGLAIRAGIGAQLEAQAARVAAAQRRHDLTDQRFRAGVSSYLNVLLAQQELFAARQAYVDARLARLLNLSSLYAALGGGWKDGASAAR
jgi:multidrug efflux system outer membrane protein